MLRLLALAAGLVAAVTAAVAVGSHDHPPATHRSSPATLHVTTTSTAPPTTTSTTAAPARHASRAATRPRPAPPAGAHRFGWTDDPFDALSACEAGMNPRRVSKSGAYRGAFQFSLSTWHGIGETGDPVDYDYAHQKAAAQRLQARSGWHQWPTCSRRLGLA